MLPMKRQRAPTGLHFLPSSKLLMGKKGTRTKAADGTEPDKLVRGTRDQKVEGWHLMWWWNLWDMLLCKNNETHRPIYYFRENEDFAGRKLHAEIAGCLKMYLHPKFGVNVECCVKSECVWIITELLSHCLCYRRNQSGGDGGAQSRMQACRQWQLHEAEEVSKLWTCYAC